MVDSPAEYIKKVYEKWKRCPICGSEDGFEVKRFFLVKCRLVCKACSAEWIPYIGDEPKGEITGMKLIKHDLDGKAAQYEFSIHPPEWWVGMDEHIRLREEKRVEESKEELIAKLDKRLINGEISEETYKQILERIKSMSEANKSKERGMEPKTEVE